MRNLGFFPKASCSSNKEEETDTDTGDTGDKFDRCMSDYLDTAIGSIEMQAIKALSYSLAQKRSRDEPIQSVLPQGMTPYSPYSPL